MSAFLAGRNCLFLLSPIGPARPLGVTTACSRWSSLGAGRSLPLIGSKPDASSSLVHGTCSLSTTLHACRCLSARMFGTGDGNNAHLVVVAGHGSCHTVRIHRVILPENRRPGPRGRAEEEVLFRNLSKEEPRRVQRSVRPGLDVVVEQYYLLRCPAHVEAQAVISHRG